MNNKFEFRKPSGSEILKDAGSKEYEIKESKIVLKWKKYFPSDCDRNLELESDKSILFLPGWSVNEDSKKAELICQELSDYSGVSTYAIKTRAEKVIPGIIEAQAEAISRMIKEKGLKDVTLIGSSLGGVELLHLAALMSEESPDAKVGGVVLLDSMSLYKQDKLSLASNYIKSVADTNRALANETSTDKQNNLLELNNIYRKEGFSETVREIKKSKLGYPRRFLSQINDMANLNPCLNKIKYPVIIIQGQKDLVSSPEKIIPSLDNKENVRGYIDNYKERENFLREKVFTSSPYVRMLVAEKKGHHDLPYFRPGTVARSALYLLERYQRDKK